MPTIDHVVLTRFNLPSAGVESLVRARERWLEDRIVLFERYCLPSMSAQRHAEVSWIIYLDPESPAWLRERMDALGRAGAFLPIYREEVPRSVLIDDLERVTGRRGEVLVTSNLDNDDGLAADFAARVQAAVTDRSRVAIYLSRGLIRHGDDLYRRRDPDNAFCSVAESWDEPVTCWADWHNRLSGLMPVRRLEGEPGWLQVVHGGNVSNRVHGVRVGPRPYGGSFVTGVSDAATPGPLDLLADRAWRLPLRAARTGVRTAVRRAVVGLVGKEGLDKMKSTLSAGIRAGT